MSEYRSIELLKTATDLCTFDAICVGGTLHGQFRSLGSLPFQHLTEVIESHTKSRVGNMRSFPYRLGSHMKYRLSLVRRGLVYLAWLHDSVPCAINSELLGSFNAALEKSETITPTEEESIEQAPFEPGDRVAPNGGYISDAVTVNRCFHRDGKWWFTPMHGKAIARECQCFVKVGEHKAPPTFDTESENAAQDATPDPKHKVLTDGEMSGPSGLLPNVPASQFVSKFNDALKEWGVHYQIDTSMMELTSYNRAGTPSQNVNRTVAPFRVGQMVRWKSKGTTHIVEAIKYVESEKCWAIRIPGHDRPYDAAMFEAGATGSVSAPPPADPQPLGARPRRNIIRKERPQ